MDFYTLLLLDLERERVLLGYMETPDFFKKALYGTALFLSTLGSVEAQELGGNFPEKFKLTPEQTKEIEIKLNKADSLCDVLFHKKNIGFSQLEYSSSKRNSGFYREYTSVEGNRPFVYERNDYRDGNQRSNFKQIFTNDKKYSFGSYAEMSNEGDVVSYDNTKKKILMEDYDGPIPQNGCLNPNNKHIVFFGEGVVDGHDSRAEDEEWRDVPRVKTNIYSVEDLEQGLDELIDVIEEHIDK